MQMNLPNRIRISKLNLSMRNLQKIFQINMIAGKEPQNPLRLIPQLSRIRE